MNKSGNVPPTKFRKLLFVVALVVAVLWLLETTSLEVVVVILLILAELVSKSLGG